MDKMVNWFELVGPNVVASLAKESDVELTSGMITLLEKFGERVESEVRTRNMRNRHLAKIEGELASTNDQVTKEVLEFRNVYMKSANMAKQSLIVRQHSETYLPITHLSLRPLPELTIYVTRQYHALGDRGVTFAFKMSRETSLMTSPVLGAINYMRELCEQQKWRMSVKDVLVSWMGLAVNLPLDSLEPLPRTRKRRQSSQRVRGRWKPRRAEVDPAEVPTQKSTYREKGSEVKDSTDKIGETEGPKQGETHKRRKTNPDTATREHQLEADSNVKSDVRDGRSPPTNVAEVKQEPHTVKHNDPENEAEKT